MKRKLILIITLTLLASSLESAVLARQLPVAAAARAGGARAGRGQTPVDKPLVDQPAGTRADRGQAANNRPAANQPKPDEIPKLTPQQANVVKAIERKYLLNVQSSVGLSPAQGEKVGAGIQRFLNMTMRLSLYRNELIDQAQKLKQGSNEEYDSLNQQLNITEKRIHNVQDNFYKEVSPGLSPEQLFKLRIFMEQTNKQIHQAIQDSRQP